MQLLDFPPEIFGNIVHELVSAAGLCKAWKLRSTCKTFADAIHYDIFAKQPKKLFPSAYSFFNQPRSLKIVKSNLALYLYNRTNMLLDADDALPQRINEMVRFLKEELKLNSYNQQQEYAMKICNATITAISSDATLLILWKHEFEFYYRSKAEALSAPFGVEDKIAAAIAVNSHDLVRKLITNLTKSALSKVFGGPLAFAITLGRKKMLQTILQCLATRGIGHRSKYETLVSTTLGFRVSYAITDALSAKKLEILKVLLKFYDEHLPPPEKSIFNAWLYSAITTRDLELVNAILQVRTGFKKQASKKVLIRVCDGGLSGVIKAFFEHNMLDPNKKWVDTTPLIAAVRSSYTNVIQAVLDAGADIEGDIGAQSMTITPLIEAGVRQDEVAMRLLIEKGAKIPDRAIWPRNTTASIVFSSAKTK